MLGFTKLTPTYTSLMTLGFATLTPTYTGYLGDTHRKCNVADPS